MKTKDLDFEDYLRVGWKVIAIIITSPIVGILYVLGRIGAALGLMP